MSSETNAIFRPWFVFGEHANGTVDISDGESDVLEGIDREDAEMIVAARTEFLDTVSRYRK